MYKIRFFLNMKIKEVYIISAAKIHLIFDISKHLPTFLPPHFVNP